MQQYSPPQSILYEDPGEKFDPSYLLSIFRRRLGFFVIAFLTVVMFGVGFVALQRPIFRSQGEILIEAPQIPRDFIRPTISQVAWQRVEATKQRILTRDKLLAIIEKYGLFPKEKATLSGTELLDLMRTRTEIKAIEPDAEALKQQGAPSIAFTLSFDYEIPELAMKVANEFLTEILREDASTRATSAAETTKILERDVQRLQSEYDALVARMATLQQQARRQSPAVPTLEPEDSEQTKLQERNLTALEAELVQKSAVYADEHPVIKRLRQSIADLKALIAAAPKVTPHEAKTTLPSAGDSGSMIPNGRLETVEFVTLEQQEESLEKNLADAKQKLNDARLGESIERAQQGERLEVIEQPSLPQKPVRPQKFKWLALAFVLAVVSGVGAVVAAESFDRSIRGPRELAKVIDPHLLVAIPYVAVPGETFRTHARLALVAITLVGSFMVAIAASKGMGVSMDFSGFGRF